jgi:hypothetical protein
VATIKVRNIIAITVTAFLLGAGCAWFAERAIADRELRSLSLAHELEVTGLCANSLKLQGNQRGDTLVVLLEQRLDSAVGHAANLVDGGARLYSVSPNLKDSVRRAADYYAAKNDAERRRSAETLLARL